MKKSKLSRLAALLAAGALLLGGVFMSCSSGNDDDGDSVNPNPNTESFKPQEKMVDLSENFTAVTKASSSDTSVATVSYSETTLTITSAKEGSAVVTISGTTSTGSATGTIAVTVNGTGAITAGEFTQSTPSITAPSATSTTGVNPDADIVVSASSLPSTVKIYNGEILVDTISSKDESLYTGTGSGVGSINVKDQLVQLVDSVVVVKPHFDSTGQGQLEYNTTYTVKFDDADVLTFKTRESAPTISNNTINVGSSSDSDFATIQGAFNYIAKNDTNGENWTINVDSGSYHERLYYKGSANVTLVGPEDSGNYGNKAVVYWKNNDSWNSGSRMRTNFLWEGENLTLKNLTFKSTYLRTVDGSSSNDSTEVMYFDSKSYLVAYNCSFLGHQDTLILGNSGGRAWFYKDYIEGDVDFIWGYIDVALFEECQIHMTADDGVDKAYIFASRTVTSNEVNKGFVLYNSNVSVDAGVAAKAYYGRSMGSETQASVINSTFETVNQNLWLASGSDVSDIAGDAAIAFKDYGNKFSNGTPISTANRLDKTYTLSERVVKREYNGRWVILNRGYDAAKKVYKTASKIWDFSSYESEFGATEDVSKNNIFIEPVYYPGLVKMATATLKVYDVNGNEVTDGITWTSSNNDAATVDASGTVTGSATEEILVNITAASPKHSDFAIIQSIPGVIASTAIEFTAPTSLVLDDSYYITATLTPEEEGKPVTNRTVTWTASEDSGILFKDDSNNTAVSTITTPVNSENTTVVGIYANGTKSGTIIGTVDQDSGVTKTSQTISISATEKTIGSVPSSGYKFSLSGYDETSPDNLFKGSSKYHGDVNHNVFWTSDRSKVATVLKWDKELTLTKQYLNIKGNGPKGITYSSALSTENWNPAGDGYDAIKLASVTGPFKVTANVAGQVGNNRALVIRTGEKDTLFVLTKSDTASAATTPYACTATYSGTDSVDVFITSSNDVRIGSIELASYTPSSVTITATDFNSTVLSLDLNGTKTGSNTITATVSDNSTATIAYSSDTSSVATVSSSGEVTAVGIGRSLIKATVTATNAEPVEKTYVVTVKDSAAPTKNYSIDFVPGTIFNTATYIKGDLDLGYFVLGMGSKSEYQFNNEHGLVFKQDNSMTFNVVSDSTLVIHTCAYDKQAKIDIVDSQGSAVTGATITSDGYTTAPSISDGVITIPAGSSGSGHTDSSTITVTLPATVTGTVKLHHSTDNQYTGDLYVHAVDVTIPAGN